jgi:HEAT repeat protein
MLRTKHTVDNPSLGLYLTKLLSSNYLERAEAARQLSNMGQNAIEALPALLSLYKDPSRYVRIQVARAILHMQAPPEQVQEPLNALLMDEDQVVRLYAQEARRKREDQTAG